MKLLKIFQLEEEVDKEKTLYVYIGPIYIYEQKT